MSNADDHLGSLIQLLEFADNIPDLPPMQLLTSHARPATPPPGMAFHRRAGTPLASSTDSVTGHSRTNSTAGCDYDSLRKLDMFVQDILHAGGSGSDEKIDFSSPMAYTSPASGSTDSLRSRPPMSHAMAVDQRLGRHGVATPPNPALQVDVSMSGQRTASSPPFSPRDSSLSNGPAHQVWACGGLGRSKLTIWARHNRVA